MKKYVPAIIIVLVLVLVYVVFFWNNKFNYYSYNESIYTDETVINDFDVYENDFIKFLYPKGWVILKDDEKNVAIYSNDLFSDEVGFITVNSTTSKPDFFKYYFISDKLTELSADKADSVDAKTKIIKKEIDGNRCVILDTSYTTEENDDMHYVSYYVERSDNYIYFDLTTLAGNEEMEKIIFESVEYK